MGVGSISGGVLSGHGTGATIAVETDGVLCED